MLIEKCSCEQFLSRVIFLFNMTHLIYLLVITHLSSINCVSHEKKLSSVVVNLYK